MDRFRDLYQLLNKENIGELYQDEPLSIHCSWQVGGAAKILAEPTCPDNIGTALKHANKLNVPVIIIGEGSNLLFDDRGFYGLVLKIGHRMSSVSFQDTLIHAQSGIWVPKLAKMAGAAGLGGIEHTVGIPGNLGGLILMNGGSQRQCIGDNIVEVKALDRSGIHHTFSRDDCCFSYRDSIFKKSDLIIIEATLSLSREDKKNIHAKMLSILRSRRKKFPRKQPNCGSVFISKPELYQTFGPPGKMIEDCGLKGVHIGAAEVSILHANFIINKGQAKSGDILKLIKRVREKVYERTQHWLECEVLYVGTRGDVKPAHKI